MKNLFKSFLSSKTPVETKWSKDDEDNFDKRGFVELEGIIESVDSEPLLDDSVGLTTKTDRGIFLAFASAPFQSKRRVHMKTGDRVTVRVYSWGGGYYPDNKIISWSSNK